MGDSWSAIAVRKVFQEGDKFLVVPDRLLAPPKHKIGSDDWWKEGWAVGDNSRVVVMLEC
jgi:hypothetical protein